MIEMESPSILPLWILQAFCSRRKPLDGFDGIAYLYIALFKHLGKDPFSRHDAISHLVKYGTAFVTFLSYLRDPDYHLFPDCQLCANGQKMQLYAFDGKIFRKITVIYWQALFSYFFNTFFRKEAYYGYCEKRKK